MEIRGLVVRNVLYNYIISYRVIIVLWKICVYISIFIVFYKIYIYGNDEKYCVSFIKWKIKLNEKINVELIV